MSDEKPARSGLMRFLPIVVFLAIAGAFGFGLMRKDGDVLPSALIDRPAPQTELPPLLDNLPGLEAAGMADGKVKLINVFASWCVPCRVEHPFLMQLAEEGIDVRGMNHKDKPDQAKSFLNDLGNPYSAIGTDENGRAGIEWGVYGVPETFVVNGEGKIVYKHIGPIQNDDLDAKIRPAIAAATGS